MKIATWNVERLKHKNAIREIQDVCNQVKADILVLTETGQRLHPDYQFHFETLPMAELQPDLYHPTETRVAIYTNYPCVRMHSTYDRTTALCAELATERGHLLVYGTIIGVYGNRHPSFALDLRDQMRDMERLSKLGDGLCFCGDYNCSFSDNYYFTNAGRNEILAALKKNRLTLLTRNQPECIDHIAISTDFLRGSCMEIEEWNHMKQLSDHKGIAVSF